MDAELGQPPLSAVVFDTSATLPFVALIAMLPVASGVGRSCVPPAPAASLYEVILPREPGSTFVQVCHCPGPGSSRRWRTGPTTLLRFTRGTSAVEELDEIVPQVAPALPPPP